ncbi:hypothetical protein LSH36_100g06002 [Paralvinella palmiformis]|uniref:Uncharacterized protein n=1 Tax=Paralvinella palmiformis TaxID=53620 RepID=A0AAD9N9R8_9ANNE|nr:hypothetical protein LSH36_100g06002 [Paralvinella palmiformis]
MTANDQLYGVLCYGGTLTKRPPGGATAQSKKFAKLQLELTAKSEIVRTLEDRILFLVEKVDKFLKKAKNEAIITKKDGKTYSTDMWMMIYDAIQSSPNTAHSIPH